MAPYLRSARRRHQQRRWSDLPLEILDIILLCLSFPDRISFGRVCSWWRSALLASKLCCAARPPPLMVFLFGEGGGTSSVHLMCVNGSHLLKLSSPVPAFLPYDFIVGSSFGWLVIASERKSGLRLQSSTSDQQIQLPSTTSMGTRIWYKRRGATCFTVKTVAISSHPTSGNCILVAQSYNMETHSLAYFRVGRDREWTTFTEPLRMWSNIAFHKEKLVVTADDRSDVLIFDFDPQPNSGSVGVTFVYFGAIVSRMGARMVSSGGQLLLVVLHNNHPRVVKLADGGWEVVESLGDRAILLGDNGAESFCTRGLMGSGFEPNCIYYRMSDQLIKFSMADRSTETIDAPRGRFSNGFEWIVTQT